MNLEQVEHIAKKLNVSNEEVVDMNRRMTNHDQSLNAPIGKNDGESENGKICWQMKDKIKNNKFHIYKN